MAGNSGFPSSSEAGRLCMVSVVRGCSQEVNTREVKNKKPIPQWNRESFAKLSWDNDKCHMGRASSDDFESGDFVRPSEYLAAQISIQGQTFDALGAPVGERHLDLGRIPPDVNDRNLTNRVGQAAGV